MGKTLMDNQAKREETKPKLKRGGKTDPFAVNALNNLLLCLTALIWGVAFVAQSVGMEYVGPFTFNGIRCIIGGLALILCIFFLDRAGLSRKPQTKAEKKLLFGAGISCGVILFFGSSLQQIGLVYTSAGKAGFITALYIVLVPIAAFAVFRQKPSPLVWVGVIVAVAGMYLLCIRESFTVNWGDFMLFLCAVVFAAHILAISYFAPKVDCVRMSCIQFWVAGILGVVCMFLFESPDLASVFRCGVPILYAGILSCGVAYTLQIVAQKSANPTVASLILSLESVFAVLSGWLILGQSLNIREILGCVLIFSAIILAQIPLPLPPEKEK